VSAFVLEPMTQAEVAAALGVTHSRVGQIERLALSKLRAKAERLGLGPFEASTYTLHGNGNRRRRRHGGRR
jgi:hypothetical protein